MNPERWRQILCGAIDGLHIVKIKYDDDFQARTYAPHIVYRNKNNELLVSGTQLENPAEPMERDVPRNFSLSKITDVAITDKTFKPHPSFSRFDERYQYGVICYVQP